MLTSIALSPILIYRNWTIRVQAQLSYLLVSLINTVDTFLHVKAYQSLLFFRTLKTSLPFPEVRSEPNDMLSASIILLNILNMFYMHTKVSLTARHDFALTQIYNYESYLNLFCFGS